MPMSVGPAPDQLAASAPASTSAREKLRRLGEEGRAGRLVDAIVRRFRHERLRVGQAGHQQAHTAEVEHHVRPRQRLGEHAAGLGGGQVALGDDDDEGQLLAQREWRVHGRPSTVVATTRPPNTLAAAFSGCPS